VVYNQKVFSDKRWTSSCCHVIHGCRGKSN